MDNLTPLEIEELWHISIKAFLSLSDFKTNEMPPKVQELDSYLANEVSDDLWFKLQTYIEIQRILKKS